MEYASDSTPGLLTPDRALSRGALQRVSRVAVLGASDLTMLLLSAVAAYFLWALPARHQSAALYIQLAPLLFLFLLGYAGAGLYPGFGLGPVETLRRLTYVTAFGFLVLAAFSFVFKLPPLYSRVTFGIACVLSLLLVPLGRSAVSRLAAGWSWWAEPVVIIGSGRRAEQAIRSLLNAAHLGYRPTVVLVPESTFSAAELLSVPVRGGLEQAPAVSASGIRTAFLETESLQSPSALDRLQERFRHIVLLRQLDDLPVEGLQIRNLGPLVGIEYTNNLLVPWNRMLKRSLDLVIGTVSLLVASPFIACAAVLVKMIDPGPMFFFQDRAGMHGRRIAVPKIRTMRLDAEKRLQEYLIANPAMRAEWETRFKLRHDPRLLPFVGEIFRRFSVDELPQIWSVLCGDMSLVGPRPFPDYHTKNFSQEFLELRQRVRPGITGLWQVTVRSDGTIKEQEAYDSYYIRNWSVWLDLYLLSRTIGTVASGRGAYRRIAMLEASGVRSIARLCAIVTLTLLCLVVLASDAARARFMRDEMHMNDFGKFYYSAGAFLDGRDMYAPTPATDLKLEKATGLQLLNLNPPHFHLLVLPLARLPPSDALDIWMGVSLFALVLSLLLIARELRPRWTPVRFLLALFATVAFAGTQAFFGTGQLSMLLLLAITLCWLEARRQRWTRAAVWLGVSMSVKPFLLVFVPYLLGTRRFRAAAIAIIAAALCFAGGLAVFGVGAHESWLRALSQSDDWAWLPMNASIRGFFRRSFQATPYFGSVVDSPRAVSAWPLVAGVLGTITLVETVMDRTLLATDRAFALLLVAAALLSPLGWVYYLWLPVGPIAVVMLDAASGKRAMEVATRALLVLASVALLWPLAYQYIFQPRPWATMTFGSTYFWGALALWALLLIESRAAAQTERPATGRGPGVVD